MVAWGRGSQVSRDGVRVYKGRFIRKFLKYGYIHALFMVLVSWVYTQIKMYHLFYSYHTSVKQLKKKFEKNHKFKELVFP